MAQIGKLVVEFAGADAALASVRSVGNVLAATGRLGERVADLLSHLLDPELTSLLRELGFDACQLLGTEPILSSADGALELIIKPVDWYVDFVTAVALRFDVACDFDLHGWPILSVASPFATVAGRGGATSLSPEGAA